MTNLTPELENFKNEVFELLSLVQPEKTRQFLHNVVHIAERINKIVMEECNNISDRTKEQINSQLRLFKYSEYQLFTHLLDFFCIYLELDVAGVIDIYNKIKPGLTKVMHIRSTIVILKQNIDYFELHKKNNSVAPNSE
jgi:ABC-type Zn2+ transport system substrate-binding protein/surface adhesin